MATSPGPIASSARMIDLYVSQGPAALRIALARFPGLLNSHSLIQSAIDREPNAAIRAQLRQVVTAALLQTRIAQNRAQAAAVTPAVADHPTSHMSQPSSSQTGPNGSLPPSTSRPSHQQTSTSATPPLLQSPATAQGSSSRLGALLQARNRPRNQGSSSRAATPTHTVDSQSSSEAVAGSSSASAGPPTPSQGTHRAP